MIMLPACKALLFDLDGTLIRSTGHFDRVWVRWAALHDIDPAPILATHHGCRMEDTIRRVTGTRFADPAAMAREVETIIDLAASALDGLSAIAGAREFLTRLPKDRWALVTSNHVSLATSWLAHLALPIPDVIVAADDVSRGKPDPEGYLKASALLGFDPQDCLVFEDAPAGIAAARAAGCPLVIVSGTLSPTSPETSDGIEAIGWIDDYRGLSLPHWG
jgi:sugar-phosphatase